LSPFFASTICFCKHQSWLETSAKIKRGKSSMDPYLLSVASKTEAFMPSTSSSLFLAGLVHVPEICLRIHPLPKSGMGLRQGTENQDGSRLDLRRRRPPRSSSEATEGRTMGAGWERGTSNQPALREEALRDVAANEARAEHKHVPRLRRRGHRRRRRHGGDSWNHPDSGSCPARLLWGAINLDDWITNSPFTVAKLID